MPKRKNSDSQVKGDRHEKYIKIEFAKTGSNVETPYLAAFPGTKPPADTKFTAYRSEHDEIDSKKTQRFLVGETDKVVYTGANFGKDTPASHCKYLVGVYSKKSNTLNVVQAPILRMHRTVKALQSGTTSNTLVDKSFQGAKASLGMAFGTAKAKKQIKDTERNAVTAEELEDILPDIQSEIGKYDGPTQDDIRKLMQEDMPIPVHNFAAETPAEAYDLSSIVTEEELHAVPIKLLLKAEDDNAMKELLPFTGSSFINERVSEIIKSSGKKNRSLLRTLVYISYLMAYSTKLRPFDCKERRKVEAALKSPPTVILDRLHERYTSSDVRTPFMEDKILCYMLVLCLSVANYSLFPEMIAKDLSLKVSKITNLLKNLGCKMEKTSAEERKMTAKSGVVQGKKATLVVPLKFPKKSILRR
ncbi:RNA polymerase I associated factor, A49-like protein [Dichotomocladium elegans]|nr:RNA polymerase I associated factor, A49-like protein [Dichotomocladium elegans]